jgi:hypothetical protein
MGSPPGAACLEQEFRTDNLPLPLLWAVAQQEAGVKLLPGAAAAYPLVGLARLG